MQIMPRSVKVTQAMPVGHTKPAAQLSAQTISASPSMSIGPTHVGVAVPPGIASQSTAAFAHPVSEQNPSVMSAFVMQRIGMFPQSSAIVHIEYMPSAG